MKTISFNKMLPLCAYCKKNRVTRWDKKCDECKKQLPKPYVDLGVGKRQGAAIWENEHGHKIVVDKFGKPIDDEVVDYRKKQGDINLI